MKSLFFMALFLLPLAANAGLIRHKFDLNFYSDLTGETLFQASMTVDANPDDWTLRQAWLHIDGQTIASDQTNQLGIDQWTFQEPIGLWQSDPIYYSFTRGDWSLHWYDSWTEITGREDTNPVYSFGSRDTFYIWEWYIREPAGHTSEGRMRVTSYNGWHKVPEPSSFALLGLGLAALAFRRRST